MTTTRASRPTAEITEAETRRRLAAVYALLLRLTDEGETEVFATLPASEVVRLEQATQTTPSRDDEQPACPIHAILARDHASAAKGRAV